MSWKELEPLKCSSKEKLQLDENLYKILGENSMNYDDPYNTW